MAKKNKTHKGTAKRVKLTGNGSVRRGKPGRHHGLRKLRAKQRRGGVDLTVGKGIEDNMLRALNGA